MEQRNACHSVAAGNADHAHHPAGAAGRGLTLATIAATMPQAGIDALSQRTGYDELLLEPIGVLSFDTNRRLA
jgi:hypothetical protein